MSGRSAIGQKQSFAWRALTSVDNLNELARQTGLWQQVIITKLIAIRNFPLLIAGAALLLVTNFSTAGDVQRKDYWHTSSQWEEMRSYCEEGARNGDPLSQVAVAIYLLESSDRADRARAEKLLLSAAAAGYDDANYWLGVSQEDKKTAVYHFEKATGGGGMGLFALAVAADIHFKGDGVSKDFTKARAVFKRALDAMASNTNKGIPKPPGEWWSNAKWFGASAALDLHSERYGYQIKRVDGKAVVVDVEPHPELSDKELAQRAWNKISGAR
jgi:hypothetical protein